MARKRDDYNYIEPCTISVTMDGVTHEGTLHISQSGNRYQYSVSYGDDYRTNIEDLMPDRYLCEVHGKMDLVSMVKAAQQRKGSWWEAPGGEGRAAISGFQLFRGLPESVNESGVAFVELPAHVLADRMEQGCRRFLPARRTMVRMLDQDRRYAQRRLSRWPELRRQRSVSPRFLVRVD